MINVIPVFSLCCDWSGNESLVANAYFSRTGGYCSKKKHTALNVLFELNISNHETSLSRNEQIKHGLHFWRLKIIPRVTLKPYSIVLGIRIGVMGGRSWVDWSWVGIVVGRKGSLWWRFAEFLGSGGVGKGGGGSSR